MHNWRFAALLSGAIGGACGGEGSTTPRSPCTEAVTVTATREERPVFTWSPDCAVARLRVEGPPFQGLSDVRWEIQGGPAGIASGVRFGVVPQGAFEQTEARGLSGFSGGVSVYGADGARLGGAQVLTE